MTLSNKNILLIAGPSASGKSHFIRKLLSSSTQTSHKKLTQELELHPNLNIGKLNIERLTNEKKVKKRSKKMRKDLFIVHFDLTSRHQHRRRNQLKFIASKCQTLKIVTLDVAFETWRERMTKRIKNEFYGMPLSQAFWIYALSQLNKRYSRNRFDDVYQEWEAFLDEIATDKRIVFNAETGQLQT